MKIDDLMQEFTTSNWIKLSKLNAWLKEFDVESAGYGTRENRTDGECDIVYMCFKDKTKFSLRGNYYDSESFRPLIEWVLSKNIGEQNDGKD